MTEIHGDMSEFTSYEVVSSIPGRMRLRIPSLLKHSTDPNTLKGAIAALEGVTSVRINPWANSIVVTFAREKISTVRLEQELVRAIGRAAPPARARAAAPQPSSSTSKLAEGKGEIIPVAETSNEPLLEIPSQPLPSQPLEALTVNSWQRQCQEQAEAIEELEDRLAALKPVAAIGSAWLRRWHAYSPATLDSWDATASRFAGVALPKPPETEAGWQELAARQIQAIATLEQCLADWQRLAVIGEARLKKHRKYLVLYSEQP